MKNYNYVKITTFVVLAVFSLLLSLPTLDIHIEHHKADFTVHKGYNHPVDDHHKQKSSCDSETVIEHLLHVSPALSHQNDFKVNSAKYVLQHLFFIADFAFPSDYIVTAYISGNSYKYNSYLFTTSLTGRAPPVL